MIYLISYPRSGNTMTRYLFELMTKQPSNGLCGKANAKDKLQQPLLHSGDDYCLHKRHDFKGVKDTDMVIFVIRDYLEAVIRHNEKPRGISLPNMVKYIDSWFELLQAYDSFKGNKMCLYYDKVQQVSFNESKAIYPDAQSTHKDYHKTKLGADGIAFCDAYAREKWSKLYQKYIK